MCIKKTLFYKERCEKKRAAYLRSIECFREENLVYIDESGVDHNEIQTRCWVKRGGIVIGERSGKRRSRTSVIAALNGDKIKAPMRYTGTANTALFVGWLRKFLVPELKVGQVVILDNCSIHKSSQVREIINSAGCKLIYLPPYSPDLNPIEHYWAVMKNNIRKIRDNCTDMVAAIDETLRNETRSFQR